jgi:hypothetical protein
METDMPTILPLETPDEALDLPDRMSEVHNYFLLKDTTKMLLGRRLTAL